MKLWCSNGRCMEKQSILIIAQHKNCLHRVFCTKIWKIVMKNNLLYFNLIIAKTYFFPLKRAAQDRYDTTFGKFGALFCSVLHCRSIKRLSGFLNVPSQKHAQNNSCMTQSFESL